MRSIAEVHCVALGISGISPCECSIPIGISKLLSKWKHCCIKACSTLRSCSPIEGSTYKPRRRRGITRNTEKTRVATSRLQCNTTQFLHGSVTRMKIGVVVQISELPFKTGGIRQYAYFILIKMRQQPDAPTVHRYANVLPLSFPVLQHVQKKGLPSPRQ